MLDKRQINDKFTFPYMGMSALKTMKVLNSVCYFCGFFIFTLKQRREHAQK